MATSYCKRIIFINRKDQKIKAKETNENIEKELRNQSLALEKDLVKDEPPKGIVANTRAVFGQFFKNANVISTKNAPLRKSYPRDLLLSQIESELKALKSFQENDFILKIIGYAKFFHTYWIVTELGLYNLEEMYEVFLEAFVMFGRGYMIVHLLAPILDALIFVHERGYIHRDIKPSNIVINPHGVPKLIDFGLCVEVSPSTKTYIPEHQMGSPFYIAPEAVAKEAMSGKSDAFSFALTAAKLYWRKDDVRYFFGSGMGWRDVVKLYTSELKDSKKLQACLIERVVGRTQDLPDGKWKYFSEELATLVDFDVSTRGSLSDLAKNRMFKLTIEDWKKYQQTFETEDVSDMFKESHHYLASALKEVGSGSSMLHRCIIEVDEYSGSEGY